MLDQNEGFECHLTVLKKRLSFEEITSGFL